MTDVDFRSLLANWREERKLDYNKLAALLAEEKTLIEPNTRLAVIFSAIEALVAEANTIVSPSTRLAEILVGIQVIIHSMTNADCLRFLANGITKPPELEEQYKELPEQIEEGKEGEVKTL